MKYFKMIRKLGSFRTFLLLALLIQLGTGSQAQMLKVSGQKIINTQNNQEVVLHAMNFGNWMVGSRS